MSYPLSIRTW